MYIKLQVMSPVPLGGSESDQGALPKEFDLKTRTGEHSCKNFLVIIQPRLAGVCSG